MIIRIPEDFILRAARSQHGAQATLWPNDGHAFKWAAKKPGDETRYGIDLQAYSQKPVAEGGAGYSADWRVTLAGMGKGDWAWFNPFQQNYEIVPFIQVAQDFIWSSADELNKARDNFHHNVKQVAEFYRQKVGSYLTVHDPLMAYSNRSSQKWYDIYQQCTKAETRFMLYDVVRQDIETMLGRRINSNLIFVTAQYCGNQPTWDWGAAGGGWLCVVSAFACCHRYNASTAGQWEQTVAYAIGHEMGHCFGLPHTDPKQDSTGLALMQRGFPPNAIFTQQELTNLRNNAFFRKA